MTPNRMRVAILTTDNREFQRSYEETEPRFGPAVEALLEGLFALSALEVHVIACTQRPMHAPEKLADNTWFHLLHVPKIGWLRTGYQGCVRALRRKLRKLNPQIVHGQGTERECALAAAFSGFPNVVTVHGNMGAVARAVGAHLGSYHWCAARIERLALRRTNGVFCNSEYTEMLVRRFNRRTWLVPNAIRLPFFARPLPGPHTAGNPVLVNIGVVAPYKRQSEVLALARELHQAGHRFELQFVGPADSRSAYARSFLEQIRTAEKNGYAHYLGMLKVDALIERLDQASALIHVPTEEAFGLVVAEALARNLKLFGAQVGGIPDIAEGVEGAELFPLGDEVRMRHSIERWLDSGCARPTEAALTMRSRYDTEIIAARHFEIYESLIRSRDGAIVQG
ncbi:MAG TPA: glycosyltransferase family 4 protein [Chthoniobacterales bacterium]